MSDHFAAIAEERHRVADFLDDLSDAQWDTPSCCGDWTVEGVAAHCLVGPVMGIRRSMPHMLKARFSLPKTNLLTAQAVLDELGRDGLAPAMREHAQNRFTPPGFDSLAPITDIVIHGQDMSRPLGIEIDVPVERWKPALETATSARFGPVSSRKHLKGLRLEATDIDFTTGDGALVSGPAKDLAHAVWGRVAAVDALEGDGVDTLRTRLT